MADILKTGANWVHQKDSSGKWYLDADLIERGNLDYPVAHTSQGDHWSRRRLYLDDVLSNENGEFVWNIKGSFSASVKEGAEVKFDEKIGELSTQLATGMSDKPYQTARVNLTERLRNQHGRFQMTAEK